MIQKFIGNENNNLLSDPKLYLRKWMGEGFVSIVDTPAVMFIWDQLFMKVCMQPHVVRQLQS